MNNCFRMAIIGAITGVIIASVFASFAKATPSLEEDNNRLEKLVSQNNACRLIVYQREGGMTRLYFSNKGEAELAAHRMISQSKKNSGPNVNILSPDCDINLETP